MTSVVTGDIIDSRKLENPSDWIEPLKKLFHTIGDSPKVWEIYRGDSFQIEIKKPEEAIRTAIRIKAQVKSIKDLDVRMAIGIGKKNYQGEGVTESNGEAFIHSGEKLESLKKNKQTLGIKSSWEQFDKEMNLYIRLALIAMDAWSQGAAKLAIESLQNPNLTQNQLGEVLGISQSSVSERYKRAYMEEIMEMEAIYREKLKLCRKN